MIIRLLIFVLAPDPLRFAPHLWHMPMGGKILSGYAAWYETSRGLREVRRAVRHAKQSLGRANFLDGELRRVYEEGFEARARGLKPSDPEYPRMNPIYLQAHRFR